MKILAYPSPSNARAYRLDQQAKYINRLSANEFIVSDQALTPEAISEADVIILQQTISPEKISIAKRASIEGKKLLVAELDDYFTVNSDNPFFERHKKLNASHWLEVLAGVADIVTTTTDHLAKRIKEKLARHDVKKDIIVLPNYLDMEVWDMPILRNFSEEIRLIWAGSCTHRADMEFIAPVIKEICKKYPQVKFLYCGDVKLKPLFKDINSEYVDGVKVEAWPGKLHSLRADIGIVPLIDNEFNRCKSNLKYLEFGICGIPAVFSQTVYAKTVKDGETGFIAKYREEFFKKLSLLIENPYLREKIAMNAYLDVKTNYDIKNHVLKWLDTYFYYLAKKRQFKVDIGGGLSRVIGKNWINLDIDSQYGEIICDLTSGKIPLPDNSIKRIHASAIFEHFYPEDLKEKVLPELFRILAKGGTIWVAVPDWQKIKKSDNWQEIQNNLYGIRHKNLPEKYDRHKYCFDAFHLKTVLEEAGFKNIKEVPYDEEVHDKRFTLAMEAQK